jgi:hypothetical protein
MQVYSHLLIARKIHKYILDNLGFNMSLNNLKYGCIKPDFSPKLARIPHYKKDSFYFISELITKMESCQLPNTVGEMNLLSSQLGVILHYIIDYFCFAHNNIFMNKIIPHFIYEVNLGSELKKYLSSYENLPDIELTEEDNINVKKSIIDYIENKHQEYLSDIQSIENDIYYSLQVCEVVTLQLITSMSSKTLMGVA